MAKHPMQPVVLDEQGTARFKRNEIVQHLLDFGPFDLNKLTMMVNTGRFSSEDYTHLMQLIGYSVSGYEELSSSPEDLVVAAKESAERLRKKAEVPVFTRRYPKTVALDFDGVVHAYTSKWTAPEAIHDGPVPGALEAIQGYLKAGFQVAIFSARARALEGLYAIEEWLEHHGFPADELAVTSVKPQAVLYVDDRGFHFTGTFPSVRDVETFKPWNRR